MDRYLIVILLMSLFFGCKDKKSPSGPDPIENSPTEITFNFPSEFQTDSLYTYTVSVVDEDGIDSVYYLLEAMDENLRVVSEFHIALNGTAWDSTLTIQFFTDTDAQVQLVVVDTHEEPERVSMVRSIPVYYKPNSATKIDHTVPSLMEVASPFTFTFELTDLDGINTIQLKESTPGNESETKLITLFGSTIVTSWDTTYSITPKASGTYSVDFIVEDLHPGEKEIATFSFFIPVILPGDTPTQFTSQFNGKRAGTPLSFALKAEDENGIASVTIKELYPNQTDSVTTNFSGNGTVFEKTLAHTFNTKGVYSAVVEVTDELGYTRKSEPFRFDVLAPLQSRTQTMNFSADKALQGVDVTVMRDGKEVYSGTSDMNGEVAFSESLPADSAVTYNTTAAAHGLVDISFTYASTANTAVSKSMQILQPTIATLDDVDPRSETQENLETKLSFVDTDTNTPIGYTAALAQQGNTFIVTYLQGLQWQFETNESIDPENVTEQFTVTVNSDYFTGDVVTSKHVAAKASITGSLPELQITEGDSAQIDLYSLFGSVANVSGENIPLTSAELQSLSETDVSVRELQEGVYMVKALTGEDAMLRAVLVNRHGVQRAVEEIVDGLVIPEFSATIEDNVTGETILENVYAVRENKVGENWVAQDTLWTTTGTFTDIDINTEYVRFGMQRNGKNFAYEHRITPSSGGNYEIVITPFIKRDAQANEVGEWTYDEMSRRHSDMKRTWSEGTYGRVNQEGSTGNFSGALPRWNTETGQPNKVILVKNIELQYYFTDIFGNADPDSLIIEQDSMSARDMGLIQDWYQNETQQINSVGNEKLPQLPELTVLDDYVYKAFDSEDGNTYIFPRSEDRDRAAIIMKSNGNGKYYDAIIFLQSGSNADPSTSGQYYAYTQESVAAFGERGSRPAEDLRREESAVNNQINVNDMQWFDLNRFASWVTNNTGYQTAPNQGKFSNAVILPKDN